MILSARFRHLSFIVAIGTSAGFAGCQFIADDGLVVATTWPSVDCARIEAEFTTWISTRSGNDRVPSRKPAISWIWLSPGDDLEPFVHKRPGVDVVLGGPVESYVMLDSKQLLQSTETGKDPAWLSIDSTRISPDGLDFQTARLDPRLLHVARNELNKGPWVAGYERLIRLSGQDDRRPASAIDQPASEGAAIVAHSRRPDRAREFLRFLVEIRGAKSGMSDSIDAPDDGGFLADLLGATLIDAREELDAAWAALKRADDPQQSLRWMFEPPPWPPASVEKIQSRGGDQAMTMIETLAGQIAPEPRLQSWLLRSWLTPQRPIDGTLLRELTTAEEGRLANEPRFRSWLRAEWTAWARQRYRRVARRAGLGLPISAVELPGASPSRPEGTDTR